MPGRGQHLADWLSGRIEQQGFIGPGRIDQVPAPEAHGDQVDEVEESIDELVVTGGDTACLLETVEALFDAIAQSISGPADCGLYL